MGAALCGAEAGEEFHGAERFRHVIIGPGVERGDLPLGGGVAAHLEEARRSGVLGDGRRLGAGVGHQQAGGHHDRAALAQQQAVG